MQIYTSLRTICCYEVYKANLLFAATIAMRTNVVYARPLTQACTMWAGWNSTKKLPLASVIPTKLYETTNLDFEGAKNM